MKKARLFKRTSIFCTAIFLVAACGGSGQSGKGEESEMPDDEGSADSWKQPTVHDLSFEYDNEAEFDGVTFYHAFNFQLSGPAQVTLEVNPYNDNFDTVMYLYRRNQENSRWGHYIARNDDYGKNLWSRLDKEVTSEGTYRVMVKGYKQSLRGKFRLLAECSGEGCPSVSGDCPEEYEGLPTQTAMGLSCIQKMQEVFSGNKQKFETYVEENERCEQEQLIRIAWDYYWSYFEDTIGWEEIKNWMDDPEQPLGFDVEIGKFEDNGTVITVDVGGDEMAMTFLFNQEQQLIVFYQHNQSPDVGWFCKEPGEPDLGYPSEDCVGSYLVNMSERELEAEESSTVVISEAQAEFEANLGDFSNFLTYPIKLYREYYGLSDEDMVEYQYTQWSGTRNAKVFHVTISASGHDPIEYHLGGKHWYGHLFFRTGGPEGTTFDCTLIPD